MKIESTKATMQTGRVDIAQAPNMVLDWLMTTIENPEATRFGFEDWREQRLRSCKNGEFLHRWTTSWAQGGELIGSHEILFQGVVDGGYLAYFRRTGTSGVTGDGDTHLVAAVRCILKGQLGEHADVPVELLHVAVS